MPKIYNYLGIVILFHSREHKPIHVHGRHSGHETKAEFIIENGEIIEIKIKKIRGKIPLKKTEMDDFVKFVNEYGNQIVQKWIDYFVLNKVVKLEEITENL
jgi:hypothetical protein